MGRFLGPLLLVALCTVSVQARAESRAEQLFNKGLEAFLAGRFDEGCPLIAQSHELEPLAGVLFTLAECQKGWGKLKTANDSYGRFLTEVGKLPPAEANKHADRVAVALRKRAEIGPKIPTLTVTLSAAKPEGASLSLGDRDISAELGRPLPLDPGAYTVRLASGSNEITSAEVELQAGDARTVELDVSGAAPAQRDTGEQESKSGAPTLAWVAGGIGVAGLAVGAVTGLMAASKTDTIDQNCPNRVCNAEGRDAVDSAQSLGLVSTVSFGVGIAGVGLATYLFLSADGSEPESTTPQAGVWLTPGGGQVSLSGRF